MKKIYKLFEFGMFADGPIHLLDSKGNITINKVNKNELFVFTTKSMLTLLGFAVFAGMLVVSRKRA